MQKYLDDISADILKIPPFRDSHIHFTIDGKPASEEQILKIKDDYRKNGIFSVIDMGHKTGNGLIARKILENYINVKTAGYAIYKKGSHGSFLGKRVTEKEEIKSIIREISDAGADFIKVIVSGVVCPKGGGISTTICFTPEELKIISDEAKEKNLTFACHANADSFIRNSVEAGTSSIEHGFYISNETLHMMAEAGVSWTPTIFPLQSLKSQLESPEKRYIDEVTENHLSSINYAVSIGVKLCIGTDSGSRDVEHGKSFLNELQWFQKAGLSLKQILSAACMDMEEIEKGNFLLVKKDFIKTRRIEAIYKDGELIQ
jgi:predicted amidohydrolase YtcJ